MQYRSISETALKEFPEKVEHFSARWMLSGLLITEKASALGSDDYGLESVL